ncbi:bifunctional diaminohydroxyphosphoribosylaminopyrimidine deaminase/5-amino-6-(5-phosphoribosylamino)uracil reductase RibD [Phaeovibrio sulfidiphilus]|uniref:Riboflavin biosynthesis protein RibD n=2 Tax=Phaeovibrio sulfidiphilus TaxID=1220600 RepID=A0A8J6YLW6_9PROT|nr:bifunctional diaminohydroxyphosphoribosylaminopyrimidine deaminase/5-amino-6-(5-phosphoribosylamino)uracil reductase RibD [Phaeovibrio sulfidiphilus]
MRAALALAARGLGRVWPNPAVGCVLVSADGRVLSRGWTAPGGRPHAERIALERAGDAAQGAVAYVTLEPCSHHGKEPPCADALIAAGVSRVVVAMEDPDTRVNGRGVQRLREAGIRVDVGLFEDEARDLNLGFVLNRTQGRPLVTLKIASTLDGRVALSSGVSKWITGPQARAAGQMLRADHDAIAVGSGTVLADDPALTCRLPGLEDRSPVRVILDSRARLPADSVLARTARDTPVWLYSAPGVGAGPLEALGVRVVPTEPDGDSGRPCVRAVLADLARSGITRLLVEGGPRLHAAFLEAGVVDRIVWFRSPSLVGGDGLSCVAPLALASLAGRPFFELVRTHPVGTDRVEHYAGARVSRRQPPLWE